MPRRTRAQIWADEARDRLVEHYATLLVERNPEGATVEAYRATLRGVEDGPWAERLGLPTEDDVAEQRADDYPILRALTLAGLASTEETVRWREANEQDEPPAAPEEAEPEPQEYDPEAEPLDWTPQELTNQQDAELRLALYRMAEIKTQKARLEKEHEEQTRIAVDLVRRLGRPVSVIPPAYGQHKVAHVVQRSVLMVDPEDLLAALIEYYGDEETAEAIWADCLKPRAVDTTEGGLFHQAVRRHSDDVNGVPQEVVAKVARFNVQNPYISFTNPS